MANPYAKYVQQAPTQDPIIKPADPYKDSAEARAQDAEARAARDQSMQEEKFAWERQRAQGQDAKMTPTEIELQAKAQGAQKRGETVNAMLGEVKRLYKQDIQGQPVSRLFGATEYIDALPTNDRFTAAGNAILPLIRPLVAQTAKEGDSDKEMQVFMAYVPNSNDSDIAIEQKFKMLEMLIGGMVDGKPPSQVEALAKGGQANGKGSFQYNGKTITFDVPEGATDAQIGEAAAKAAREAGSKVPAAQFNVNREPAQQKRLRYNPATGELE